MNVLKRFLRDQSGATAIEYGLIAAGISVAIIAVVQGLGSKLDTTFTSADPIYGDVQAGDEIPYLPRHQASGTFAVEWSHAGASIAANYVSEMREEAGSASYEDSLVTDDLFTLDVGSKVMPLKWLTIYGNVRNLLDTQSIASRRPYGARPNAPRWVQIGAKLSF